ncbi:MAG: ATP-binding protein [Planctomycetes bacterium]|nr:ATP-binding protein [Planctomycetota bacterium]
MTTPRNGTGARNPPTIAASAADSSLRTSGFEADDRDRRAADERRRIADQFASRFKYELDAAGLPHRHVLKAKANELHRGEDGRRWRETYERLRPKLSGDALIALLGPRGTGKTQMGVCWIVDLIKRVARHGGGSYGVARYVKAGDLLREVRATFQRDSRETDSDAIRRFASYHLLVIDELHELGSEFDSRTVTSIVDARYDACRSTVLISNETKPAFEYSAGPSIVSRMIETGEVVICDWPSFRHAKDGQATREE